MTGNLARNLIGEWIWPSPLSQAPLDRLGESWWRSQFEQTGYIAAAVREHGDEHDIILLPQVAPNPGMELWRVQQRGTTPRWSWWDNYFVAKQHLAMSALRDPCIVKGLSPASSVFATVTYQRVTEFGSIEIGMTEVICEVDDWS